MKKRLRGLASSARNFPRTKNAISTGTRVMATTAPMSMAKVLVKASGRNSAPSCPSKEKIGKKLTTTISRAKKMGRPTCLEEAAISSRRSLAGTLVLPPSFLWTFSSITTHASIIAPMAIAMPPRLMMFDSIPKSFMAKKVRPMVSGKTISTTRELGTWSKKRATTTNTTTLSSSKTRFSVLMEASISALRSYTVTTSTSSTCKARNRSLTA